VTLNLSKRHNEQDEAGEAAARAWLAEVAAAVDRDGVTIVQPEHSNVRLARRRRLARNRQR
jgi:hypothetical protein